MNFVADENIDEPIIHALRNLSINVLSINEQMPGCNDSEVLKIANENDSFLITSDKDFGELVFRQRKITKGIILIRLHGLTIENKISVIKSFFENHKEILQYKNIFIVVSKDSVRIRKNTS